MRRRDRIFLYVLIGSVACNLVTALVGIVSTRVALRRAAEAQQSAQRSEKSSIEAAASVVAIADHISGSSLSVGDASDEDLTPVPVVLGYGQTRSKGAFYIYRDVDYNGVTRREYVQRIPFAVGSSTSGASQKPF